MSSIIYKWLKPLYFQITEAYVHHRLPHANLIIAPKGVAITNLMDQVAKYILCNQRYDLHACGKCLSCQTFQSGTNPDFYELGKTDRIAVDKLSTTAKSELFKYAGKTLSGNTFITISNITDPKLAILLTSQLPITKPIIKIDDVRALNLSSSLSQFPEISNCKVVLIHDAHSLSTEVANSLLKIIEEPPENCFFFLSRDESSPVLPTINSRCTKFKLDQILDQDFADIIKSINPAGSISSAMIKFLGQSSNYQPFTAKEMLDLSWPNVYANTMQSASASFSNLEIFSLSDIFSNNIKIINWQFNALVNAFTLAFKLKSDVEIKSISSTEQAFALQIATTLQQSQTIMDLIDTVYYYQRFINSLQGIKDYSFYINAFVAKLILVYTSEH